MYKGCSYFGFIFIFSFAFVVGCGEGKQNMNTDDEPIVGEANPESIAQPGAAMPQSLDGFAMATIVAGPVQDTGSIYSLKLDFSKDSKETYENSRHVLLLEISGGTFIERTLMEGCQTHTQADTENTLATMLNCDLSSVVENFEANENIELFFPINIIPYQTNELLISASYLIDDALDSEKSFSESILFKHDAYSLLGQDTDLARNLPSVINMANGEIVKRIHDGFRTIQACTDGGQIEIVESPSNAFAPTIENYRDCSTQGISLNAEVVTSPGRSVIINRLSNASMVISGQERLVFMGDVEFTTERFGHDTTVLNGTVELTHMDASTTLIEEYSVNCDNGKLTQPNRVSIPGTVLDPITSLFTVFETNVVFLGGARINVSIDAKFKDQGTVFIESDDLFQGDLVMVGGPYPTIYLDLTRNGMEEKWITPWTDEWSFDCQTWGS